MGALDSFDMMHETKRTMRIAWRDVVARTVIPQLIERFHHVSFLFDQLIRFYPSGAHNPAIAGGESCVTITPVLRFDLQAAAIRYLHRRVDRGLATGWLGRAAALFTLLERHFARTAAQPCVAPGRRLAAQQLTATRRCGGS
jgi:hypothetical protein